MPAFPNMLSSICSQLEKLLGIENIHFFQPKVFSMGKKMLSETICTHLGVNRKNE